MFNCEYCNKEFSKPITSGHKRKCQPFLDQHPENRLPPTCLCGHDSTSLTQMKRHRIICDVWKLRDKNLVMNTRIRRTFQKNYGEDVTNSIHVPKSREKKAKTNKIRYGAENVFSKESTVYDRVQSYWDGKDRTAHLPKDNFANPKIKQKIKEYWLNNYGVNNCTQVPHIRQKQLQTSLERFGDEQTLRVPSLRQKARETNLLKYGFPDPAQSLQIKQKISNTNIDRYGIPWTTLGIFREKQYESQIAKYGKKFFASDHGKKIVKEALLNSENIPRDGIRKRAISLNRLERRVHELAPQFIFTGNGTYWKHLPLIGCSKNPDFILPGPDHTHPFKGVTKVIEALGIYWHGQDRTGLSRDEYASHLIEAYSSIGISCLVIWEDEIWDNIDSLQRKIDYFINYIIPNPIISQPQDFTFQDLLVSSSDSSLVFSFLNENHYAGYGRGSTAVYVASLDNELVAVAKFSPPVRQTIHRSINVNAGCLLELDRFCINPSYQKKNLASWFMSRVIRMIKKDHEHISAIVSFADPGEGHDGTIYKASNWKESGFTSHSYYYSLPNGVKMNKKTLFNKSRTLCMNERDFAISIGAIRVSTPPKKKFVYYF